MLLYELLSLPKEFLCYQKRVCLETLAFSWKHWCAWVQPHSCSNYITGTWQTGRSQTLIDSFVSELPFFLLNHPSFHLYLYSERSVPSPWAYSNFLGPMVWPLTSRENLWTPLLSHGDSTTSATHGPTPASRYDTPLHTLTQESPALNVKERLLCVTRALVVKCKVTVWSWLVELPTNQTDDIIPSAPKSGSGNKMQTLNASKHQREYISIPRETIVQCVQNF